LHFGGSASGLNVAIQKGLCDRTFLKIAVRSVRRRISAAALRSTLKRSCRLDQTATSDQDVLWNITQRSQGTDLDCCQCLSSRDDCQKATEPSRSLLTILQILEVDLFEKIPVSPVVNETINQDNEHGDDKPIGSIYVTTGQ